MIGKTIGNYEITGELASGGMGTVFRARHMTLPREVVVKSIRLSSFPPRMQEPLKARFLREAFVQSQLDHPNIVRVLEFFTTAENYFLVMEYVAGLSLRELLQRQGRLQPDQALSLFKQSLDALDYAHNFSYVDESGGRHRGITHRDIKPGNLLIDGMGRLKLTDFGIVKLAGERSLTRTGFNPGTAEYMSPEQIRGQDVDARSDLYSLGVTFYEMLAGRLPFPPSDTGSEYEVLRGHIELNPPPIAASAPGIPSGLAAIVMQSLEKDPNTRFQTAAAFLQAFVDYERKGVTAPQTIRPQPQVTHSGTEKLPTPSHITNPATDKTRSRAPQPTPDAPPTNVLPPPHVQTTTMATAAGPDRRTGLIAGLVLLGVVIIAAPTFWLWQQRGSIAMTKPSPEPSPQSTTPSIKVTPSPKPALSPSVAMQDELLRQARAAEAQERYRDAIQQYEAYLAVNRDAPEAAALRGRVDLLKKLNGWLVSAEFSMGRKDYVTALRNFHEALQLRPESKLAQAGMERAGAALDK